MPDVEGAAAGPADSKRPFARRAAGFSDVRVVTFFTRGMSLKIWDHVGMFEREVALYRALRPSVRGITFVTYGDAMDLDYADHLDGIRILCNRWRLPERWYIFLVSRFYPSFWRGSVVIKSNQVHGADIALRTARQIGRPFIARCGYLPSDNMTRAHGAESPQAQAAVALERQVFTQADRVVVTTPFIRQRVIARYQLPPHQVRVIPNYVDVTVFAPGQNATRHPRRLCYVGRLDPEKNPGALLEAIEGLDVELVIVGDGSLRQSLSEEVSKKNLPVRFLGNLPNRDLPAVFHSAAVFVMPSLLEGHPKALLEAMACGLPVIGTDVPGIRELIRHRETGFLCECSPRGLREAIGTVLADQELRSKMGASARAFVLKHFALERILELEWDLLAGLAAG